MPIPFACPYCQEATLVEDEFAGQTGPCVTCGKQITVPLLPTGESPGDDVLITGIAHQPGVRLQTLLLVVGGALLAGIVAIVLIVAFLFPAVGAARSFAQAQQCDENLRRIGVALLRYEADNGTLPPAFVPGPDGEPMHSWRVLLLPYLDEHGLHGDYDFSQPWDSPQNQRLATRMPHVYSCPAEVDGQALGEPNYMVVVGPSTVFPGATPRATNTIGDAPGTTIAVVEVPANGTNWLQPTDLKTESMQFVIDGTFGTEIGSYHQDGARVLMCDGSVRRLGDTTPADYVQGMLTSDGGESIPWDFLAE